MTTFGKFYDALLNSVENDESEDRMIESRMHMETWAALVSEEQWAQARAQELDEGSAQRFASDMLQMMRERIVHIGTEEMYDFVVAESKRFRKLIAETSLEFGHDVSAIALGPVTWTEAFGCTIAPDPENN